MESSNKVSAGNYDNSEQSEIVRLATKHAYFHYRMSIVVEIPWTHFYRSRRSWSKTPDLPLDFPSRHSSRDINISGFGGHIAISGCRLLSQSHG